MSIDPEGIEIFSTCPQSKDVESHRYLRRIQEVARWSDAAGYRGILVYTDNSIADPWLVSQVILECTETLCPLIAVQPVYMHPFTAAKLVSTFGYLYGRRVYLNMVAGGFRTDLAALGDLTPHDDRYVRAVEYATIVKALVAGQAPVTFDGRYYSVTNLKLLPPLAPELAPGIVISGSSQAGLEAAKAIGATAVKYPKPPGEEDEAEDVGRGVRVGIIAREDVDEAWRVALGRFPEDRKGQITHALAMKVSDSKWHEQLADLGGRPVGEENPYWLGPFKNYKTFCPYLVGSYDAVGIELGRYMGQGFRTFILDVPASEDEFDHTAVAFERAAALHP